MNILNSQTDSTDVGFWDKPYLFIITTQSVAVEYVVAPIRFNPDYVKEQQASNRQPTVIGLKK